jgi:hypothetical protein
MVNVMFIRVDNKIVIRLLEEDLIYRASIVLL